MITKKCDNIMEELKINDDHVSLLNKSLKGDIAMLILEITKDIVIYMKENGYEYVDITPLITHIMEKGNKFLDER